MCVPYWTMSFKELKDTKEQRRRKELQSICAINFKAFVYPQGIYNQVREVIHKPLNTETRKQYRETRTREVMVQDSPGISSIYIILSSVLGIWKNKKKTLKQGSQRKFSGTGGTEVRSQMICTIYMKLREWRTNLSHG